MSWRRQRIFPLYARVHWRPYLRERQKNSMIHKGHILELNVDRSIETDLFCFELAWLWVSLGCPKINPSNLVIKLRYLKMVVSIAPLIVTLFSQIRASLVEHEACERRESHSEKEMNGARWLSLRVPSSALGNIWWQFVNGLYFVCCVPRFCVMLR